VFNIPQLGVAGDVCHLNIEFSEYDTFNTVVTYSTLSHYSMFRIFTGLRMESITSSGVSPVYSEEQIQFDVTSIDSKYKYFRFQWIVNDNAGRYGFGNRESSLQAFERPSSTSSSTTIVNNNNKKIEFNTSDSEFVTWNGSVATFTHNMNCIPLIAIYDDNLEQILYGIKVINGNSFSIDFKDKTVITGTWKMIVSYGVEF
jgi:hypothetical protein